MRGMRRYIVVVSAGDRIVVMNESPLDAGKDQGSTEVKVMSLLAIVDGRIVSDR